MKRLLKTYPFFLQMMGAVFLSVFAHELYNLSQGTHTFVGIILGHYPSNALCGDTTNSLGDRFGGTIVCGSNLPNDNVAYLVQLVVLLILLTPIILNFISSLKKPKW